jgi:cell division protein ZapA (FtsZ GTPase activity inhibitor)
MADLKPIGSEKLQGQDKINRILEIARYKENTPSSLNETSRVEFERVLADGNNYEIVKEKSGYVIKKKVNESLEYIEPMKNRKHYGSYSAALKRLNLIAGEVNRLTENEEEVSMFNLGEQKKFTLKTPKPAMPAPAPEAAPALPTPPAAPEAGSMDAPLDDASLDAPEGDEMDFDMDVESPEGDMDVEIDAEEGPMGGEEEEVTFKTIQKLTGKLGQKIRMMNDSVGMTSEDVKYVINSLLSALDLSKLDEEDQEDIMAKFEEDQESDYDSDMDMGSMGDDDELDMDMEMDVEEPMDGEMGESMYGSFKDDEWYDENDRPYTGDFDFDFDEEEFDELEPMMKKHGDSRWFQKGPAGERMFNMYKEKHGPMKVRTKKMGNEMSEEDKINSHVSKVMDEIFSESKIDKVLSSYFEITESEKKEKKQKLNEGKKVAVSSIKRLSETIEQELAAEFIVRENSNYKLVGKTNKSNLVFEHNGEQIRVTPKGEVL